MNPHCRVFRFRRSPGTRSCAFLSRIPGRSASWALTRVCSAPIEAALYVTIMRAMVSPQEPSKPAPRWSGLTGEYDWDCGLREQRRADHGRADRVDRAGQVDRVRVRGLGGAGREGRVVHVDQVREATRGPEADGGAGGQGQRITDRRAVVADGAVAEAV